MPFLCQSLFGHGETPPFWCQQEWRAAADFAVTRNTRQAPCWQLPQWEAVAPPTAGTATSPNEVLAVPSNIADGVLVKGSSAMPMAARIGAKMEQGVHGSAHWHRNAPCLPLA